MSPAAWTIKQVRFAPAPSRALRVLALLVSMLSVSATAVAQVNWDAWRPKEERVVHYPDILVTAAWVQENQSRITLIDTRDVNAYKVAHLPGALPFPFSRTPPRPSISEVQDELGRLGLTGKETVVLYGGDALPLGDAFWVLEFAGQAEVKVLNGGVSAWEEAGGGLSKIKQDLKATRYQATGRPELHSNFEKALESFGRKGTTLLDWRTPEEWAGGHIPHSLPFPLEELQDEGGLLKSGPDMRKFFSQWGPRVHEFVDLKDHVIVCGSGPPRSVPVHPYLGARIAGIDTVSYYPHGTSEWKSHPEAPLTRLIDATEVRRRIDASWEGGKVPDLPPANLIVLDLRGRRDYEVGHIQGAVWIPPHRFQEDFPALLREHWPGVNPQQTPVIFYCYGKTCTRSRNCSTWAGQFGFTELLWFKDGTEGWKQAGEKLVRAAGAP
ncbi:MAG: hypothetical protein HKN21_10525 [Candidatus Eisenbacteria bacterium]|uniref:Rhodanese domain-containing protein n=1 Tax=Eiseniibacteriota bacterium TaxID=2212470 RepID=A0A7Y2E8I9_UNCEI|nr:hypothetical protein [Candidatus Eisenbacteria bacterium]